MAGASLLALLDDIAVLLDDVSVMTKVAAKKTAGVLGDDLAVNAEKVTGVPADRELPVVFAVFRGSLLNKALLVPAALAIAAVAPWLISPLLIAGGLFLCFEGAEKIWHALQESREEQHERESALRSRMDDPNFDVMRYEQRKIRGAVRTDFILSAEIIVITLGIVGDAPLVVRAGVLTTIALLMTLGVYGLVAGIVKMDDAGLHLVQSEGESPWARLRRGIGRGLVAAAPRVMKLLAVLGTAAMFLVGGGILVHGIHTLHALSAHSTTIAVEALPLGGVTAALVPQLLAALLGLVAGSLLVLVWTVVGRLRGAAGH